MAAVDAQPPPPTPAPRRAAARGFSAFLKDGVVAAARNPGLFLPLAALHAGQSMAYFFFANKLLPRYFDTAVDLDAHHDGNLLLALLSKFLSGRWHLLVPAGFSCIAAHEALGMAIDVATATAAVASCSSSGDSDGDGEPRRRRHATTTTTTTMASLLGKVRRNLLGPMDTDLHGEMVGWAIDGSVAAVLVAAPPRAAYLGRLVELAALLFTFFYFGVVRAVAVVVSVAEPGRCGEGAVGRARRLMRGRRRLAQAALCAPAAWVLMNMAVWEVHAPFRLDGVVVYLLLGALKVVCAAIVTAYYYDCRRAEEEEKAGHRE